MSRAFRLALPAAAAALAAACATGGSSDKLGPSVNAPTLNQAPERTAATVSPTPAVSEASSPAPTSSPTRTETRHSLPDLKPESPDPRYEYRLYYYLPVNAKGQNELGLLLRQLTPDGWELHKVHVAPVGHCKAIFRRDKQVPVRAGMPTRSAPPALPPAGTAPPVVAPPAGNTTGMPSSLPPAPAR